MSTLKTGKVKTTTIADELDTESTAVTNVINGSAKAWVNFNGTGTVAIRNSFNVNSITDIGTGEYNINFINAMPDANYSTVISVASGYSGVSAINRTGQISTYLNVPSTTAVSIQTGVNYYSGSTVEDEPYVFVTIHR
jgi:hypothetical protein